LVALVGFGTACADGAKTRVSVRVEGAVIAPHRADGRSWNGGWWDLGLDAWQGLGAGALPRSYGDLISSLANLELSGVERPNVYGDVLLESNDGQHLQPSPLATRDAPVKDLVVAWPMPADFPHVDLTEDVRVGVQVWNRNGDGDDFIGVAEINSADLTAARDAQRPYPVNVAAQTNNQLLYVNISVRAE
jgi:hypothetical protein